MTIEYPEELNFVKKIGPLPLFWGSDPKAMDLIEAAGYNDYYLLAQDKITLPLEPNKAQTYAYRPSLFLITKTIMGRVVLHADEKTTDLYASTAESAQYFMPKMPYDMVKKMDHFFRSVHKQHGTEAILVLTYDPVFWDAEDPSAGWNCIAPEQQNTAGECDYKPDSVLERKKEHELIMGTIHSHPEMSAFFSGVDHKDQDDWDGIHITQAWKGNGPTEYHIAMILGGKEWTLREDQVFCSAPLPKIETEVVDQWMEHVTKKIYANNLNTPATYNHGVQHSQKIPVQLPTQSFIPADKIRAIKLPADAPDPGKTIIIAEYPADILTSGPGKTICRMCKAPMLASSITARRCLTCASWIILEGMTIQELAGYRSANNYTYDINLDVDKASFPIVVWNIDSTFSIDLRNGVHPKV